MVTPNCALHPIAQAPSVCDDAVDAPRRRLRQRDHRSDRNGPPRVQVPGDATPDRRKIVVGYDGSQAAERALERAAALAGDQTRIVVVGVAVPYPRSGITIPANDDRAEIRRRRDELEKARRFLSERSIPVETIQARGDPAGVLLEAARDADLLVVGSRRLGRLQRLVLGSVSSELVHDAACDVLVVR